MRAAARVQLRALPGADRFQGGREGGAGAELRVSGAGARGDAARAGDGTAGGADDLHVARGDENALPVRPAAAAPDHERCGSLVGGAHLSAVGAVPAGYVVFDVWPYRM